MTALRLTTYCAFVLIMSKGLHFPLIDVAQPILITTLLLIIGEVRPYFRLRLQAVAYLVAFSSAYAVLMDAAVAHYSQLYDNWLIQADTWLGFNVQGAGPGPAWLKIAYCSFLPQIVLAVWFLDSTFIRRFTVVGLIAICMVILLPCRGNYAGGQMATVACHFDSLKTATVITWKTSEGILTMPSVHAATAVLLIVGFLRTRLFLPVLLLNMVMIYSCVPIGRHYVVDLIAGAAVAAVAIFGIPVDKPQSMSHN